MPIAGSRPKARHAAAVGLQEAEQRLQERGLARAVGAEQARGPGEKGPGDAGQRLQRAVGDREVLELDERGLVPGTSGGAVVASAGAWKRSGPPGFRRPVASRLTNVAGPRKVHIMASSLIEPIARVGFAARGVVYVVVGVLAARAAAGQGGRTTDTQGAVRDDRSRRRQRRAAPRPRRRPGRLRGVALRAGGRATSTTRAAGMKGLAVRAGYAGSGLIHLGAGLHRGRLRGLAAARGRCADWVARVLAEPLGPVGGRPAWAPAWWARGCTSSTRRGPRSSRSTCARDRMSAERAALVAAHRALRPGRPRGDLRHHRMVPRPGRADASTPAR